jgi:hypothetical protein
VRRLILVDEGIVEVGISKKIVFIRILADVIVANMSIFKTNLNMTSLNVILTYYTYNTSNKKISS